MISEDSRISSRAQLDEWLKAELPSYKISFFLGGGIVFFN